MDHAEGAARGPACGIDEQILVMWRALRSNPSLDARWAMQGIDRLLGQRAGPAQLPPPGPPAVTSRASVSPGLQLSSGEDGVRALLDVLGGGGPARDADPHGRQRRVLTPPSARLSPAEPLSDLGDADQGCIAWATRMIKRITKASPRRRRNQLAPCPSSS